MLVPLASHEDSAFGGRTNVSKAPIQLGTLLAGAADALQTPHAPATLFFVARRRDRHRREAWGARAREDVPAQYAEPFNGDAALVRWQQRLGSLTGRGFTAPPFAELVLGPVIRGNC